MPASGDARILRVPRDRPRHLLHCARSRANCGATRLRQHGALELGGECAAESPCPRTEAETRCCAAECIRGAWGTTTLEAGGSLRAGIVLERRDGFRYSLNALVHRASRACLLALA
ncbi:hypothetical protein C8Q76DRAFT_298602 [Earliella scabrosa]|nr:hypothetical protein C8Q76DRAFT_298602 [Earliella scabrosa]